MHYSSLQTSINVDIIESNQTQANTALSIDANQAAQQTTTNNSRANSIEQQLNNNSRLARHNVETAHKYTV